MVAMRKGTQRGVINSWITRHANGENRKEPEPKMQVAGVDGLRRNLMDTAMQMLRGGDIKTTAALNDIAGELSLAYMLQQLPDGDPGRKLVAQKFGNITDLIEGLDQERQQLVRDMFGQYLKD